MAEDPSELEREIDAIRHDLDDVADELEVRLVDARRKLSPRYALEHHPVAILLASSGLVAVVALVAAFRRYRIRRIARYARR